MHTLLRTAMIATGFLASLAGTAHANGNMAGDPETPHVVPVALNTNYMVQLNNTEVVYLPEPASAVVVGNPDIADVSVHSADTIFIVGRGFGETNLVVLNTNGYTIMNSRIQVTNAGNNNNVRVYAGSGLERTTYNCSPYCQPAPMLGDVEDFVKAHITKTDEITNTFASGSSVTRAPIVGSATESQNRVPLGNQEN